MHRHFKLFKPYGYLSQFDSNARHQRNSKFLREFYDFPDGVMAIGRLDKDSEGLLLVTTDGNVSNTINSSSVEKEYYVQIDGLITDEALLQLQQGLDIPYEGEFYKTKPCKVRRIDTPQLPERAKRIRDNRHGDTSWLSITITEGKYRQVRRMTNAVGFPTLRLVRVRIGHHLLEDMQPSEVIELKELL